MIFAYLFLLLRYIFEVGNIFYKEYYIKWLTSVKPPDNKMNNFSDPPPNKKFKEISNCMYI